MQMRWARSRLARRRCRALSPTSRCGCAAAAGSIVSIARSASRIASGWLWTAAGWKFGNSARAAATCRNPATDAGFRAIRSGPGIDPSRRFGAIDRQRCHHAGRLGLGGRRFAAADLNYRVACRRFCSRISRRGICGRRLAATCWVSRVFACWCACSGIDRPDICGWRRVACGRASTAIGLERRRSRLSSMVPSQIVPSANCTRSIAYPACGCHWMASLSSDPASARVSRPALL